MTPELFKKISYGVNQIAPFTKETFENPTKLKKAFDRKGFEKRFPDYQIVLSSENHTIEELTKRFNISEDLLIIEIHMMCCLSPGSVLYKYISPYIKSGIQQQKQMMAITFMQQNYQHLSIDTICEKLNVSDKYAQKIAKRHSLPVPIRAKDVYLTYLEFMESDEWKRKVIRWYHQNPYSDPKKAVKRLKIPIEPMVLKNALARMIDEGYNIPCFSNMSPLDLEMQGYEIVKYKQKYPYATPTHISKKFGLDITTICKILDRATEEWKQEKLRSYEFYFRNVMDELDDLSSLCYDRFHASPNSSSRWLELAQNNLEKKIKLMGLNAPAELHIRQNVKIESREEKDAIIEAFLATDLIDVSPKNKKEEVKAIE